MPCAKGMTKCRPLCGHREMVRCYQLARHVEELAAEAITGGHATELAALQADAPLITFKRWLVGRRTSDAGR